MDTRAKTLCCLCFETVFEGGGGQSTTVEDDVAALKHCSCTRETNAVKELAQLRHRKDSSPTQIDTAQHCNVGRHAAYVRRNRCSDTSSDRRPVSPRGRARMDFRRVSTA